MLDMIRGDFCLAESVSDFRTAVFSGFSLRPSSIVSYSPSPLPATAGASPRQRCKICCKSCRKNYRSVKVAARLTARTTDVELAARLTRKERRAGCPLSRLTDTPTVQKVIGNAIGTNPQYESDAQGGLHTPRFAASRRCCARIVHRPSGSVRNTRPNRRATIPRDA